MIHAGGGILHRKRTSATAVHNTIRRTNKDPGGSDNNNKNTKGFDAEEKTMPHPLRHY